MTAAMDLPFMATKTYYTLEKCLALNFEKVAWLCLKRNGEEERAYALEQVL